MGNLGKEQIPDLARAAAAGSEEAFNELYLLTRDRAYFVAVSITKNEDDALDILQDAYLKAWQSLELLRDPGQFSAWFNQIAANQARDFLRRRKPLLFASGEEDDSFLDWQPERDCGYIPDAALDAAETRKMIMGIVDGLPEDQRLCVLMYYYNEMDVAQMAAALEISPGTVKSRLYHARKKISDGVEKLEKSGTKLYGAAPIPLFLVWLLRSAPASSQALPPVILSGSAGAAAGAVTGAAAGAGAATAAGTAGGSGLLASIALPKIVAVVAAAAVVTASPAVILARREKAAPIPPAAGTMAATEARVDYIPLTVEWDALLNSPVQETFPAQVYSYAQPSAYNPVTAAIEPQGYNSTAAIENVPPPVTQQVSVTAAAAVPAARASTAVYVYEGPPVTTTAAATTTAAVTTTAAATTTTITTAAEITTTAPPPVTSTYTLDTAGSDIWLTAYNGPGGVVAIPAASGITVIDASAFEGSAVTQVTIPEGVTRIRNYAFRNCASLTLVEIPASVTVMGPYPVFAGCPAGLTIRCPAGSYAEEYAFYNGINCETY